MRSVGYVLLLMVLIGCGGEEKHDPFDRERMYAKGNFMKIDTTKYIVHVDSTTFYKQTASEHWSHFLVMLKQEGYKVMGMEIIDGVRTFLLKKRGKIWKLKK